MRRALAAVALIGTLLIGTGLTGCADDVQVAEEPVILRVLMADDWATRPPILEAVRTFEAEHPEVRVDIVGRPFGQIMDELNSAFAVGRPHDVIQEHAFAAGARGLAEPLDDWWAQQDDDEWFAGGIADVTWGDRRYGVPLDINALFLIGNTDLVDVMPTTFPEVRALADAVADQGARILPIPASNWWVYGWIRANGGEIVEIGPDGQPTFTLDRPENAEALQFLADLVAEDQALGPTPEAGSTNAFSLFASEDAALLASGTWDSSALAADHPEISLATAAMPGGVDGTTSGSVLGGSSLFIGRGSEHRELAMDFIATITADDVAIAMAELDGRLPPRPALFPPSGLDGPLFDGVLAQLDTAHPQRLIAFPVAQTAYEVAVDEALTGRVSAAEALSTAQRAAVASLSQPGGPGSPINDDEGR